MKKLKLIHSNGLWSPEIYEDPVFVHLTNGLCSVNEVGLEALKIIAKLHGVGLAIREVRPDELEDLKK